MFFKIFINNKISINELFSTFQMLSDVSAADMQHNYGFHGRARTLTHTLPKYQRCNLAVEPFQIFLCLYDNKFSIHYESSSRFFLHSNQPYLAYQLGST